MTWTDHAAVDYVIYDTLPAGTLVQRCYRLGKPANKFWASTDVRFGAAPDVEMLYTGTTDAAAVCETLLRDPCVIRGSRNVLVPYDHIAQRGLATLRLLRGANCISLCQPAIHAVISDSVHLGDVDSLIRTRAGYEETERFAQTLLLQAPALDALAWPSQRAQGSIVYCFYDQGISSAEFEVVSRSPFDTKGGYERLRAAVRAAGLNLVHDSHASTVPDDDP